MKEHEFTMNDLVAEYLMAKVTKGYEPNFTTSEFMDFLYYFNQNMKLEASFYQQDDLFKAFINKNENDEINTNPVPYINIKYDKEKKECIVSANYNFNDFYKSTLNTYFLTNGMGRLGKGKTGEIRNIIDNYLKKLTKRKIIQTELFNDTEYLVGKYIAAMMVQVIWNGYVEQLVSFRKWPRQCTDINTFLFEKDLSEIIGLESKKEFILDFYKTISKRISILYHNDKNLKISSLHKSYLARSNYETIIRGYQKLVDYGFGDGKNQIDLDLSTLSLTEVKPEDGIYSSIDSISISKNNFKSSENPQMLIRNLDK